MILTKNQTEKIKKLIERYYNVFIFKNLGPEFLSSEEIKDLPENLVTNDYFKDAFILGKIASNPSQNPDKTYEDFKARIFNRNMGLTPTDQRALEVLKESIAHYVNNLKSKTSNHILSTIHDKNKETHLESLGEVVQGTVQQALTEGRQIQELAAELREKTGDVARDWKGFVRTELGNAVNQGAAHVITQRNTQAGVDKEDILVYKQGPLDEATCKFCKQFWHDGNSYKVYRLSELTANGSNVGKKQANWKPTIDVTHPHCRHRLMELLPGWTLDENGSVTYVSPDHHELNNNQSDLNKSFDLEKGKKLPIGTVRQYGNYKYIKHADGWVALGGPRRHKLVDFKTGGKVHPKHSDEIHGKYAKDNDEPTKMERAPEKDVDSRRVEREVKISSLEKEDVVVSSKDSSPSTQKSPFKSVREILYSGLLQEDMKKEIYTLFKEKWGRGGVITDKVLEAVKLADYYDIDLFSDSKEFYSRLYDVYSLKSLRTIVNIRLYGMTGVRAQGKWSTKHIRVLENFETLFMSLPAGHVRKNKYLTKITNHSQDPKKAYAFYSTGKKMISLSDKAMHKGKLSADITKYSEFSSVLTHEVGHSVSQKLFHRSFFIYQSMILQIKDIYSPEIEKVRKAKGTISDGQKKYEEFAQLAGWHRNAAYLKATGSDPSIPRERERPLLTNYSRKSVEECFAEYYSIYHVNKESLDPWLNNKTQTVPNLKYRDTNLNPVVVGKNRDLFEWMRKNIFENKKLLKSLELEDLEKGKKLPIGTVRQYGNYKYIKHADGWVALSGPRKGFLVDFKTGGKEHPNHTHTIHTKFAADYLNRPNSTPDIPKEEPKREEVVPPKKEVQQLVQYKRDLPIDEDANLQTNMIGHLELKGGDLNDTQREEIRDLINDANRLFARLGFKFSRPLRFTWADRDKDPTTGKQVDGDLRADFSVSRREIRMFWGSRDANTLFHELGHAIDNSMNGGYTYLTSNITSITPPELRKTIQSIFKLTKQTPLYLDVKTNTDSYSRYLKEKEEVFASAFEIYINRVLTDKPYGSDVFSKDHLNEHYTFPRAYPASVITSLEGVKEYRDHTDKIVKEFEKMFSILKDIREKKTLQKSLKGKTPTFTGHKLHKRIKFQGMDISIENRKGSYRKWKDKNGKEGKSFMFVDYGYIRRTLGNDGDHVDVFVGPNRESTNVYIIHQVRPDTGQYDEDKVMLGFNSPEEAKRIYLKHYNTPKFFGSMDELDIDQFKSKVLGKRSNFIKSKLELIARK